MDKKNIAGVVLAGGKSSRMAQDKALLNYREKPLLDHMIGILERLDLAKIYVSGELEGYNCLPDVAPYSGPAHAMQDILKTLESCEGVLFLPVDMPYLTPDVLNILLAHPQGAFFEKHPLPAFIKPSHVRIEEYSVRALLKGLGISAVPLPEKFEPLMINANTPEQWQEVLRA